MHRESFSRVSDLGILPAMVADEIGSSALPRIFREQGLNLGMLEQPLLFMPARDFCGLHEWAVRLSGDPDFGFRLAEALSLNEIGPLAEFLVSRETLQSMIESATEALSLHLSGARTGLEKSGDVARFFFRSPFGMALGSRHAGMRSVFAMMQFVRWFMGPSWLPQAIEVEYAPHSGKSLDDHFGVPVFYNRPRYALVFSAEHLVTANPILKPVEQRMTLLELAAKLEAEPPRTMSAAVRSVLALRLMDGEDDIDGAARKLGIGLRSLQRALSEEGTSYRETLVDIRTDRATMLLTSSSVTIAEIAHSLGYSSASHFTRAFVKRTGRPPSSLRKHPVKRVA